jgi:hypothetical protein
MYELHHKMKGLTGTNKLGAERTAEHHLALDRAGCESLSESGELW